VTGKTAIGIDAVIQTLSILAPGLLGASLAMASHERGVASRIQIYARRQETIDALGAAPWCDFACADPAVACEGAELVVICAPVDRIISLAAEIAPRLVGNPIVTDVGSVKSDIVRRCQRLLCGKARFVGSHPMAGSEKTGMGNASPELFQDRSCFLTPSDSTDGAALKTVSAFWSRLGSSILQQSPAQHDATVAAVSHLPHLLASSLASFLASHCEEAEHYCGNGLRDTTRIASGNPRMWTQIIGQNREAILESLNAYQARLEALSKMIGEADDEGLLDQLSIAKQFRDSL